ncbi:MAG: hypothetical protein M1361_02335 [Patescibacteria group bacterium]|nr:hypothetical protein [Patescibacteria group bacterium]MCL5224417.1 hypothetical protein [Patescibacteria group bacterium]
MTAVAALCAILTVIYFTAPRTVPTLTATQPATKEHLSPDLYPIYPGATWGAELLATSTGRDAENVFPLAGYAISSETAKNITDIAAITIPFETYYRQRLAAAGWQTVIYMEAGGPGSSETGYVKGDTYVVVGYHTIFHSNVAGPNSPVACPCDTTLYLFSGSVPKN